ncbi:dTDP-4-dehydrorhamnose reductase [Faecalicatena sp. AGMB00832]|uniref:dTDP-4-dehydrorhamnose reductase n=1 Tax=Faecalicatena faecalis TaxID=2726362 RepID=A0ABS6D5U3_9FIRM|nr:dTDP-4-dehydrorhamnose reductase [Faecalicatena faecalis]MBU3876982.1 dTDP-4-dehydrorhamnose reductase [Faecalicatena faecalis]
MGYDYGKIWVAGASGRVGTMIHNMLDMRDVELFETDIEELDITNANEVNLFGLRNRPNTIINCAGLTDVRACEENMELAYKVNALGARNLSAVARKIDARIIQISTDDIFWDKKENRFHEFDTPNPRTVYGKSKLAGENFVKELAPKHLIIRSSWVYGKEGDNFVNSIIKKAKSGQKIEAAVDDYACPTSAKELSRVILRLIQAEQEGIYHAVCEGYCSRYMLAQEIVRLIGREDAELVPVKMGEVHPSLDGPEYTILDNMMLRMCEIQAPVSWQEALAEYIADCFPENSDINRNERKGRGM